MSRSVGLAVWLLLGGALHAADLPKQHVNSLGMKLVPIAAGEFIMGAGEAPPKTRDEWNERDWDEAPAHKVRIAKSFLMGATEVTNVQYEQFDPEHQKLRGLHGYSKGDDDPVVMVTWQQAVAFCDWLSKQEKQAYRLPTEAEWEYACRAGTATRYHTGDSLTPEQANFGAVPQGKRPGPLAVGSYPPNAWGLFDMHGNVAEWCHDWFGPYEAAEQADPVGRADGWARVVRGWSYQRANHKLGAARYCRSSNRSGYLPDDANRTTGFRVVCGALPSTTALPVSDPPLHQQNVRQDSAPKDGPDPAEPYFADISAGVTIEREQWGPIFGHWNHFSAITVCPNGDVLAVWYTTVSEGGPECAQAATRLRADTGKWDSPSFFFGTPDCNTHAPVLLSDGKRLYHFCTQSLNGWDDAAECLRTSDDNGATWSRPRIILKREDPLRMSQPCSALVAKNGHLVLAADGDGHRDERVITSADRGDTWRVARGDLKTAAGKYAIHPAIVERTDGALLAFLRGPHPMPAFVSQDEGETWEAFATPLPGISVGQKAAALKLASGALLVCSFDSKRELFGTNPNEGTSTFAALSLDDGQTWAHVRQVKGPRGYLSLAQAPNGLIYLLGPGVANPRIHCVDFNERWLKEGKALP
jgi:formylglycine-generating enzyme required for sulfatase activity